MRIQILSKKGPPDHREFKIAKKPNQSFFRRPDLPVTNKSFDPWKSKGGRKGVELRGGAEDEGGMPKTVQSANGFPNTSIRKYPQPPSAPYGQISERRSHYQRGKLSDFTIRCGYVIGDRRSVGNPDKSKWSNARIVEESMLSQEIEGPIRIFFSTTDRPLRCPITNNFLTRHPFHQDFGSEEVLKKLLFCLFVNLNMTITMRGDFMPFTTNHLHDLGGSFCNVSKNEECGLDFKTAKKGENLLNIAQDSTFPLIRA